MADRTFKRQKFSEFFRRWELTGIHLNLKFAELEFEPTDDDMTAAWDLYVELLTRIATQELVDDFGSEEAALNSIFSIFETTRKILHEKGRKAENFTKVSIIVLNQVLRPFTTKWHRKCLEGAFTDENNCKDFRNELVYLQIQLVRYSRMLAEMACVEDLTAIVEMEKDATI